MLRDMIRRIVLALTVVLSVQVTLAAQELIVAPDPDALPPTACKIACGLGVLGCCYYFKPLCDDCSKGYDDCVAACILI